MKEFRFQCEGEDGVWSDRTVEARNDAEARAKLMSEGWRGRIRSASADSRNSEALEQGFKPPKRQSLRDPNLIIPKTRTSRDSQGSVSPQSRTAETDLEKDRSGWGSRFLLILVMLGLGAGIYWYAFQDTELLEKPAVPTPQQVISNKIQDINSGITDFRDQIIRLDRHAEQIAEKCKEPSFKQASSSVQDKMRETLTELVKQKMRCQAQIASMEIRRTEAELVMQMFLADQTMSRARFDESDAMDFELLRRKYMSTEQDDVDDLINAENNDNVDTNQIRQEVDRLMDIE
ncbi:MAG: hypothetical protein CMJ39_07180 [Phycisphaerae bacterium]|nr:hypothetical protein [Phycisphaerae bacterium]